jgi:hypothetical protein
MYILIVQDGNLRESYEIYHDVRLAYVTRHGTRVLLTLEGVGA